MSKQILAVPAKRLDTVARNVAMLLVFLLPILFLPASVIPFAHTKFMLVALTAFVPLIIWGLARFRDATIMYSNNYVIGLVLLLPLVYFISALLSGNTVNSIIGSGYENGTFIFILLLTTLFVTISTIFTSIASSAKMLLTLCSSFGLLAFIQIIRLIFGADNILPSIFSSNPTSTLIGSWNDLAVLSGLVVIVSLMALIYAPRIMVMRVFIYINFAMALFLLIVVNLKIVWVMLALLSLTFFAYFISTKIANQNIKNADSEKDEKRDNLFKISSTVVVFAVSVLFIFAGTFLGSKISTVLNIQNLDVRPSWDATTEIMMDTYKENILFGTGPNTFATTWIQNKPEGVNSTDFWNVDFNSGIGIIPTAFVTTGLIGGVLWLLFIGSIIYIAFRILWARMPNDTTRFIVFATLGGSLYLLCILVMYVPQTVILAITFAFVGLFIAVARNVNIVKTRKVSINENHATRFIFVLVFTTTMLIITTVTVITIQRAYVTSLLERSMQAAQSQDLERAQKLAKRAELLTVTGIFGGDDRVYSILSQVAVINLREVLQGDTEEPDFKEKFQDAVEDVIVPARTAIDVDSQNYNNHIFLGRIYEQLASIGTQGASEAALASYRTASELNNSNPYIPLLMARTAFNSGNLEDAKIYAEKSIALKRNYADAYYILSQISIKNENTEQAIETTKAAVVLTPDNIGLLFQLGVLQYSEGNYQEAATVLNRAISINPDYSNALYYLALSLLELNDTENALIILNRVKELNPDNEEVEALINSI